MWGFQDGFILIPFVARVNKKTMLGVS